MARKKTLYRQAKDHINRLYKSNTLLKISGEIGIDYEWLRKFHNGKISDPSVNRIQKILDHKETSGAL